MISSPEERAYSFHTTQFILFPYLSVGIQEKVGKILEKCFVKKTGKGEIKIQGYPIRS